MNVGKMRHKDLGLVMYIQWYKININLEILAFLA